VESAALFLEQSMLAGFEAKDDYEIVVGLVACGDLL